MIRVNTDSRSSSNVTRSYKWNVKINQIDCTSKKEEIRKLRGNIKIKVFQNPSSDIILNTTEYQNSFISFTIAPEGCLQYFQDREGTITSFNWDGLNSRQYMPNQHYSICFKRGASDCQVNFIGHFYEKET